jgi:hypothetical protein
MFHVKKTWPGCKEGWPWEVKLDLWFVSTDPGSVTNMVDFHPPNGDFTSKNRDLTEENGDFTNQNGDLTSKKWDLTEFNQRKW